MRRGSRNAWLSRMDRNLEEDGSETEDTSEAGAGEGSSLASTSGGDIGGADGRDDNGGAAGTNDAGRGSGGGVGVAGAVECVSYFHVLYRSRGGNGTHQLWQITDEVVMMGLVTVQGQSEMVRVVA